MGCDTSYYKPRYIIVLECITFNTNFVFFIFNRASMYFKSNVRRVLFCKVLLRDWQQRHTIILSKHDLSGTSINYTS